MYSFWPFSSHEWPRLNFSLLFQTNIKQTSDENKEKYKLGEYQLIQYQILQNNNKRIIWQTVRRIANEILGVKLIMGCSFNVYSLLAEQLVKIY